VNLIAAQVPDTTARWWVLSAHEIWYLALFILIFSILVFLLRNRSQLIRMFNLESDEVVTLRTELSSMKQYVSLLETKLKSMELVVTVLLERSAVIPEVPKVTSTLDIPTTTKKRVQRPVLLVYGVDEFGEQDRLAMRRAGVAFFRLKSASLDDLRLELQRRRSDDNLYDVVHISSHGGDQGLLLEDKLVSGNELSEALSGVRAIFLGTCTNQKIADKLVGIVKYVIVVYEEIESNLASDFVFEFYKRYKTLMNIEESFNGALSVLPQVSEFVDLRVRSE